MIINKDPSEYSYEGPSTSATEALPAFSEELQEGHVAIEALQYNAFDPEMVPPPPFTPYEAEYFTDGMGNIISHDPHLNEDGEALTRFLLTHSSMRPQPSVRIHGQHSEQRTRLVTRREYGETRTITEHYTEQVVDFSFSVGFTNYLTAFDRPTHYSLGDSEPAYRGKMYREINSNIDGYISTRPAPEDQKMFAKNWRYYRTRTGLPPWIGPKGGWQTGGDFRYRLEEEGESQVPDDAQILKSSRTLRQWADNYCQSNRVLKEFVYEKVPYGWSINELESAIRALIASTYYKGHINITWENQGSHIFIRPDTRLSRTLSNNWLKLLLWITLIYPFIWLFKRFHSRGGGRWQVCGAAYPYKRLIKIDPSLPDFQKKCQAGEVVSTRDGSGHLQVIGWREGQWFKEWEVTIRESVLGKVQTNEVITVPNATRASYAGGFLDGYNTPTSRIQL